MIGQNIMDTSFNTKEGVVKLNTHNKLSHELAKTKLVYMLKKEGHKVYTEIIFYNQKRADIFIPELLEVFEVLETETKEEFDKKKKEYPQELKWMFGIKAEDILKEDFVI